MWHIIILIGILICAFQAIRSERLLVAALWLAGTSALTATMMYLLGAYQIAVIELSVGAGLVTVLFVFAINIAGEEPIPAISIIPKPVAWVSVIVAVGLLAWQLLPLFDFPLTAIQGPGFQETVWAGRKVDLYLQTVLIFAGVVSMVALLSEEKPKAISTQKEDEA